MEQVGGVKERFKRDWDIGLIVILILLIGGVLGFSFTSLLGAETRLALIVGAFGALGALYAFFRYA
jgi:uncharacterized membrane protein YfcA